MYRYLSLGNVVVDMYVVANRATLGVVQYHYRATCF